MNWQDLATRVRKFDIATCWAPVDLRNDPRVREHLAVVRFTITVSTWQPSTSATTPATMATGYTTITHDEEQHLPFGDNAEWSDITRYGEYIQVITEWAQLI
jgi:hypothetical protein